MELNLIYLWIAGSSAVLTSLLAVIGAAAKVISWLNQRFDTLTEIANSRHIDNLQRFARIETQLKTLINGHHK